VPQVYLVKYGALIDQMQGVPKDIDAKLKEFINKGINFEKPKEAHDPNHGHDHDHDHDHAHDHGHAHAHAANGNF